MNESVPTKSQILFFLQELEMFSGFSDQDFFKIAQSINTKTVEAGKVIFLKGDPSETLYIIYTGKIDEYAMGPNELEMIIKERREGDFFGEMGMLNGKPQIITAVAASSCVLITISRENFMFYLKQHPEIALYLLKIYSQRLQESAERQIAHVYLDASARLAFQLLKMDKVEDGGAITISQEELASRCGMVRQTVAKLIGQWKKMGWLSTQRGQIKVLNMEALKQTLSFSSDESGT